MLVKDFLNYTNLILLLVSFALFMLVPAWIYAILFKKIKDYVPKDELEKIKKTTDMLFYGYQYTIIVIIAICMIITSKL